MRRSMYNNARSKQTIKPQTIASDTTTKGTAIDLHENLDASRSALVVIQAGTITDGSYAVTLEESDTTTDGDFSTVAAPDLEGTAPTLSSSNDETDHELGYVGHKRYLRVKIVSTSTSTGGVMGASIVRGFVRRAPISHS